MAAYDYEAFMQDIFKLTKIDLTFYKQAQMKRRIDTLITKSPHKDYQAFVGALKTDKKALDEFVEYITINVSEFYRNPEQWEILTKRVFPMLIEQFGTNLNIWSAACSTGDEPYSLVMALSEFVPLNKIRITATDISDEVVAKAKIGLYGEKSIANVPDKYKREYFVQNGPAYQISDKIKNCVTFKKHNLLKDEFFKKQHLIVCRNVLIYFTEEAKDEIFAKYYDSLADGGVLFIGSTEQIMRYKDIGYKRLDSFYYQR
ncbi:MAG: protein-glutamate O-methyltransferase CheR [Lachnospiraceae bacterium]|jgi:chemotaxis protein methyltransferase CheR|nr:protein-glutamate O-methyltransferase CheR [Lachnospiraceae bacterium]